MEFKESVFRVVLKIKKGNVSTYKEIAKAINNPRSSRAVGNALNQNQNLEKIPCHRVICSNGKIGGYVLGQKNKIKILKHEGIIIKNKKVDLSIFFQKLSN